MEVRASARRRGADVLRKAEVSGRHGTSTLHPPCLLYLDLTHPWPCDADLMSLRPFIMADDIGSCDSYSEEPSHPKSGEASWLGRG